jgi:hypothetical protein
MSSRIFFAPNSPDWKQAYMAAILEKDYGQIPGLIQKARAKLSERLREPLVGGSVPCDEAEAIHDALYMLQALLRSLSYRDQAGERASRNQGTNPTNPGSGICLEKREGSTVVTPR